MIPAMMTPMISTAFLPPDAMRSIQERAIEHIGLYGHHVHSIASAAMRRL
jgi:hypothetical protein